VLDLAGASADYETGLNELAVQQAVVDQLQPGDVFVDVGANIGFFSLLAARAVGPEGKVIAIEAVAELAAAVRANAELNGFAQIEVVEAAASDVAGEVELMLAEHPGGATISRSDTPPDLIGRRTVTCVTLDGLFAERGFPGPVMVKVDVEGAEFPVLDGMAGLLHTYRPVVLCELDSIDASVLESKISTFHKRMIDLDYQVRDLSPSYEGAAWNVYHGLALTAEVGAGHRSTT
jgi:FkbM family methyltransferase